MVCEDPGVFIAVIDAIEQDEEGSRILDRIEEAHGLSSEPAGPTVRRYRFGQFADNPEAIAWLEAQAQAVSRKALDHVAFGVPGKNA